MAAPLVTFTPLHLEREGSNHPLNNRFPTCTRSLHQPSETYTLPGSLFSRKSLSAFTTWKKLLTTYFTSHHAITELNCVNVFFSFLNYYCLLSVFYRLHLIIKRKYLKLHIHFRQSIEKFSCKFAISFLVLRYLRYLIYHPPLPICFLIFNFL